MKILIQDVTDATTTNRGTMASILGAVHCIKQTYPESEIHAYSGRLPQDKLLENYGIKVLPHPWYKASDSRLDLLFSSIVKIPYDTVSTTFRRMLHKFGCKTRSCYDMYDLLLILDVDSYNERYYGSLLTLFRLTHLLLAQLLIRKPIILGPATIGQFTTPFTYFIAKQLFKRCDFVAAREKTTKTYLTDMGLTKESTPLIPELGYVMAPAGSERIDTIFQINGIARSKKRLVGIAPSQQLPSLGLFNNYPTEERQTLNFYLMKEIILHIQLQFDAEFILVAHSPNFQTQKDDRIICQKLYYDLKNYARISLVKGDYSADELKGVIGRCDIFVACRMHAAIAALSQGIPTVSLTYGQKYAGVIGDMLNMHDCLISIEQRDYSSFLTSLKAKTDMLFQNHAAINRELTARMAVVEQQVQLYANLIKLSPK
jgi:polysaccharide pyruvyl transferase WcaK-like protein